jgi:hypothetical protein
LQILIRCAAPVTLARLATRELDRALGQPFKDGSMARSYLSFKKDK